MKRLATVFTMMLMVLVAVSGVALAAKTFNGTSEPDRITGTTGDDRINGRGGDDIIKGLAGDDRIIGGPGEDRVIAGPGDDFVSTWKDGRIRDYVNCGPGEDTIETSRSLSRARTDFDTYVNCENRVRERR